MNSLNIGASEAPWYFKIPKVANKPKTNITANAITFINDIQNSLLANNFKLKIFKPKINNAKIKHQIHWSTPGNHRPINIASVINWYPKATVQVNQYNQATTKPTPGWIYLLA